MKDLQIATTIFGFLVSSLLAITIDNLGLHDDLQLQIGRAVARSKLQSKHDEERKRLRRHRTRPTAAADKYEGIKSDILLPRMKWTPTGAGKATKAKAGRESKGTKYGKRETSRDPRPPVAGKTGGKEAKTPYEKTSKSSKRGKSKQSKLGARSWGGRLTRRSSPRMPYQEKMNPTMSPTPAPPPQFKLVARDGAAGDGFGFRVAIYGDTAVVGAPEDGDEGDLGRSTTGARKGAAYVFNRGDDNNWSQRTKLVADDGAPDDRFGWSVDIFDDTIVVGALGNEDGGQSGGSAYLFSKDGAGDDWTQRDKLMAGDGTSAFGGSVAIHDGTVIVGAQTEDDVGSALIYANTAGNNWTQEAEIIVNDTEIPTYAPSRSPIGCRSCFYPTYGPTRQQALEPTFEPSLSPSLSPTLSPTVSPMQGTSTAPTAGGTGSSTAASNGPSIVTPSPTMSLVPTPPALTPSTSSPAGDPIQSPTAPPTKASSTSSPGGDPTESSTAPPTKAPSTSSTVGDPPESITAPPTKAPSTSSAVGDTESPTYLGLPTYVPTTTLVARSLVNVLIQKAELAADGVARDDFGGSVGIYGNNAIVSIPGIDNDRDGSRTEGSVFLFVKNGNSNRNGVNTWTQEAKLVAEDGEPGDRFGWSVGIYENTCIIGAPGDDNQKGSAYIFVKDGLDNKWSQRAKLRANDGAAVDEFGSTVGIDRNKVVVGAPGADKGKGSAYVFETSGNNKWSLRVKLVAEDGGARDLFARSGVGIQNNVAIVGAPWDGDGGSKIGSAYIFPL